MINELMEAMFYRYKMLNDLLVKSFAVLKVRALQPVMLCLMQYLPKVKPEYLNAVVHDPQLYADAAVEVNSGPLLVYFVDYIRRS